MEKKLDIGVIGLSVMGSNLALNMADHGFAVGGYNRSPAVTEAFAAQHPHPARKGGLGRRGQQHRAPGVHGIHPAVPTLGGCPSRPCSP